MLDISKVVLYLFLSFVIIGICLYLKGRRSPETIQGVATLLGIMGTFGGIIYALASLDFNNLNRSIPLLLNGIYPAFITSITGVGVSVWVYLHPGFWKQEEEQIDTESGTDSQILRELKELNKNIAGDSVTSLNTQMWELKDAVTTKQDELIQSFDSFAEKMVENNMNALQEVIQDFNMKLQEQFGENFKQLNDAVGKLLDWQDQYQETIENTQSQLQQMLVLLNIARGSMQNSAKSLAQIIQGVDSFKENADALKTQLEEARHTIGAISDFSNRLDGAADTIKSNMEDMMDKALEDLGQNLKGISEALVDDYQHIQQVFDLMSKKAREDLVLEKTKE